MNYTYATTKMVVQKWVPLSCAYETVYAFSHDETIPEAIKIFKDTWAVEPGYKLVILTEMHSRTEVLSSNPRGC
jgi:hypothetical protein